MLPPSMRFMRHLFLVYVFIIAAVVSMGCGKIDNKNIDQMTIAELQSAAARGNTAAMVEVASHYYRESNYLDAVEWYQKAANLGDAFAQFRMGFHYYLPKGVKQDYAVAFKWFSKAAQAGRPEAQTLLAEMYYHGRGVAKDEQQAFVWYSKAANQNEPAAQTALGTFYKLGIGVGTNLAQAVNWYEKAANNGNHKAQLHLGDMYLHGEGIDKNEEQAAYWYKKSALQGNPEAQMQLGFYYAFRNELEESYKWLILSKMKDLDLFEVAMETLQQKSVAFTSQQMKSGEELAKQFCQTNHE